MTTAPVPQPRSSAAARGWRNFRRWRRGRPFWGGLLLLLSGLEIFFSGNLRLTAIDIKFGTQGFLSYVIPAVVALCGVLVWVSPAQRMFYGIVGSLVAVYSLIGVNLGGFFVGMLIGILGGALSVAWAPVVAVAPPSNREPEPGDDYGYDDSTVDELMTGPLTDVLPNSMRSPLHEPQYEQQQYEPPPVPPGQPVWPAGPAEPPPNGELPRRGTSRLIAITLVPLTLGAIGLSSVRHATVARAETCPPAAAATPTKTGPAAGPTKTGAATATAAPSASPSATTASHSNPIGDIVGGIIGIIGGLLGGGHPAAPADPTPTPTAAPSGTGAPTAAPTKAPTKAPTTAPAKPCGTATGPGSARTLAVGPDQPPVNAVPSLMTAASLTMSGLSFDGVVDLPTKTGTLKVLQFSMSKSVSTPFQLLTAAPDGQTLAFNSSSLTVQGNVKFFTTKFQGNLFGLIPVTFTPESPPPLILPELVFSDARIELAFVRSDVLTAPSLTIEYRPAT